MISKYAKQRHPLFNCTLRLNARGHLFKSSLNQPYRRTVNMVGHWFGFQISLLITAMTKTSGFILLWKKLWTSSDNVSHLPNRENRKLINQLNSCVSFYVKKREWKVKNENELVLVQRVRSPLNQNMDPNHPQRKAPMSKTDITYPTGKIEN